MSTATRTPFPAVSHLAVASLAVVWNGYGVLQFLKTLGRTPQSLMEMGMSSEQAQVYAAYPAWMSAGFALGAFGGVLGALLLLARRRLAQPVLVASLAGYLVLYVGDLTEGVFRVLGAPQVVVLSLVLAIAAALVGWARRLAQRGQLG